MKIFIIDGYGVIYRFHYAYHNKPLINSSGKNISALIGFARLLFKLIREKQADAWFIALDSREKTFRHEIYDQYKANRQTMPEDLISQIPMIVDFIEKTQIPILRWPGLEADDLMGAVAQLLSKKKHQVYLLTADKDAYQLITDDIFVLSPGLVERGGDFHLYDKAAVEKKLEISLSQVIDYMALVGDSSDNIQGVKGIGPKTAVGLLRKFQSLDKIYDNIEKIEPQSVKQKLIANKEIAYLSQKLVTIKKELPAEADEILKSVLNIKPYQEELFFSQNVHDFFITHEIPSLAKEIAEKGGLALELIQPPVDQKKSRNYCTIKSKEQFDQLVQSIQKYNGWIALDTETTSPQPMWAELIGFSVSFVIREIPESILEEVPKKESDSINKAYYVPVKSMGLWTEGVELSDIQKKWSQIWHNGLRVCGQNYKYDYIVLKKHGLTPPPLFLDTMIASYLIAPGERRHNLDNLALIYLKEKLISYDDLTKVGKKRRDIREVPLEELAEYAAEDADVTLRLSEILFAELNEKKLWDLYLNIELPLVRILAEMEMRGVAIDEDHFNKLAIQGKKRIQDLEKQVFALVGHSFNLNSTSELQKILFSELNLTPVKKTKTGLSTDVSVLEALRGQHPLIDLLLEYRTVNKLQSTYIEALPRLIEPHTRRIHSSFNQAVAATGRLSSSDPNLQNIPIREAAGRDIRRGFVAAVQCLLLSADYSQIELRILAHFSRDQILIDAFIQDRDIHTLTASQIFGVKEKDVTGEMRRIGKTVNFSVIYGQTPFGLSKALGIPQGDARRYIENYFRQYPGVVKYRDTVLAMARDTGYVETLFGHKRWIDGLNEKNRIRREGAERMAFNTPIQGSASDIIKIAMIKLDNELQSAGLHGQIILQVHDELLVELPESEKEQTLEMVKDCMEKIVSLKVPLKVSVNMGENWDAAH